MCVMLQNPKNYDLGNYDVKFEKDLRSAKTNTIIMCLVVLFLISKLSSPQTFETPEAQEPKRSSRIRFSPTSEISCGLIAGVGSCLLSCLDPLGGPALPHPARVV